MAQIETIKVGGPNGTVYNITADGLTTPRSINGVMFDGTSDIANYAICSTAAATPAKVVTITGFSLSAGAMVRVKFTAGNTATAPTLNVNSTGAKAIVEYGSTAAGSAAWAAGEVVDFCYDGTSWCMVSGATGTDTVRGKVIVDAAPTSGSTNAVQSGGTADMIASMTEAAYITQSTTGTAYTRATMTTTNETGFEIKVNDAADNIPLKSLVVAGPLDQTATQLAVTAEAETVLFNQLVIFGTGTGGWTNGNGQATVSVSGTDTMVMTKTSSTAVTNYGFRMVQDWAWTLGHDYYVSATITPDKITTLKFGNNNTVKATFSSLPAGVSTPVSAVFNLTSSETNKTALAWHVDPTTQYTQGEQVLLKDIMLIDLTAMFGVGKEPATPAAFLTAFPNAASYIDTDRTGTKMSRAYGQTQYGDYIGQTYTIDIPAAAIPSETKQFQWNPVAGTLWVQSAGDFDVQAQKVTSYLGDTRIYCADSTGVTYSAERGVYCLDPTIAYENLRNAIVSLGGNV